MASLTLETFTRRVSPWISLALGVGTVLFLRRGLAWAPVATLILVAAWVLASLAGRRLLPPRAPDPGGAPVVETRGQRLLRTALRSLVAGLYQNVLFFLVPIWAASATLGAWNALVPALLAAMAVFSCFDVHYTRLVIERRVPRTVWSALLLFAALVPAGPLLTAAPLRWYVAVAAYLAAGAGILVGAPGFGRRPLALGGLALLSAAAAGALFAFLAPFLPPVPIQCMDRAVGTGIEDRQVVGRGTSFEAGIERVYVWFAVAAPDQFRQEVRFVYRHDGEIVGRPFTTTVTGGRKAGFRTWSYVSKPWPGRWRVELRSDAGQLIARADFTVSRGGAPRLPADGGLAAPPPGGQDGAPAAGGEAP